MKRLLYVVIFICFLDLFIELPIITPFALSLGATEYLAGMVVAAYSLFNLFGNVFGGYFSDKMGRKNILLIGMLINIVVLFSYSAIDSVSGLLMLRVVHGFSSGMLTPVAFSLVADLSKKEMIGRSMALTGVSIGSAAVFGPAAGGIISSQFTYQSVYFVLGCIYVIGILITFFAIKESTTIEERQHYKTTTLLELLKRPSLNVAYISSFTLMIANGTLAFGLPLKVSALGLEDHITGMMLSIFGITAIIVFASKINIVYTKFKAVNLVAIGIGMVALSMIALHIVPGITMIIVIMLTYGLGFSLIFPSMNKMIAQNTEVYERGKANGIFYAYFSIGSVAGSFLSGIFATYFELPFIFIGVIILIMLTAQLLIRKYSMLEE
jgi:MFS family permease